MSVNVRSPVLIRLPLAILLFAIHSLAGPAQTEQVPKTVEHVLRRWKDRQDHTTALDVESSGTRFEHVDPMMPQYRFSGQPLDKLPRNITFPIKRRYVEDSQGRSRFDLARQVWNHGDQFEPEEGLSIFDGEFFTSYSVRPSKSRYPSASRHRAGQIRPREWYPIALAYRPFKVIRGEMAITNTQGVVEGRPCLVLGQQEQRQDGTWETQVWVDPVRDYLPVRYYLLFKGKPYFTLETTYRDDGQGRWAPASWTLVELNASGEVRWSETMTVRKLRINEPIPDETFKFEYPPGTYVKDYVTNERFVVKPSGERRVHAEGESYDYEHLLNTDPPRRWLRWLLGALAFGVVILLAVAAAYRFRRVRAKTA